MNTNSNVIERPDAAIEDLTNNQGQADMDGVMVKVSRQAVDEVLTWIASLPNTTTEDGFAGELDFKPWSGGKQAPDDWDGGNVLLFNGDQRSHNFSWEKNGTVNCVIGYRTALSPSPSGDVVEALAQFLHDEGGFDEAWIATWPAHPNDTGQRGGGYVKLVPIDVQAKFRDVAKRLAGQFLTTPQHTTSPDALLREVRIALNPLALGWRGGSVTKTLTEDQWAELGRIKGRIDQHLQPPVQGEG